MGGYPIWSDDWWQSAEDSQLISIENHSWDHLHKTLDNVEQVDNLKGDFKKIVNLIDADKQIKQSSEYINSQIKNKNTTLFAYPYGDFNEY
jgi:peptidoglycan/xylan/chitin deacetylase (PgdA/CDA1 family)